MLSEEVNEGGRVAQRKISILVERVADDELRNSVRSLMSSVASVGFSRSEKESEFHLEKAASESNQVLEQIGTVLRRHYEALVP